MVNSRISWVMESMGHFSLSLAHGVPDHFKPNKVGFRGAWGLPPGIPKRSPQYWKLTSALCPVLF